MKLPVNTAVHYNAVSPNTAAGLLILGKTGYKIKKGLRRTEHRPKEMYKNNVY